MGTGPVFMPLLSVREEHIRRIGASLSDLVGCAAYGHSRGAFINGACPLSPFSRFRLSPFSPILINGACPHFQHKGGRKWSQIVEGRTAM